MTRVTRAALAAGRFPLLQQFVAGYLHEDFPDEHGSVEGARAAFLREASAGERAAFRAEAAAFLLAADALPWTDVRQAFTRLGGAWAPRSRAALSALLAPAPLDQRAASRRGGR